MISNTKKQVDSRLRRHFRGLFSDHLLEGGGQFCQFQVTKHGGDSLSPRFAAGRTRAANPEMNSLITSEGCSPSTSMTGRSGRGGFLPENLVTLRAMTGGSHALRSGSELNPATVIEQ